MSGEGVLGASLRDRAGRPSAQAPAGLGDTATITGAVHGLGIGKSNDWNTPADVFEALGCRFDLDVSAPLNGPLHVPTSRWFSTDALAREWQGFVWMNPPFGGRNGLVPWLDKFFAHGNGIALTPDRTSAPWFHDAWRRADAVMFTRKTPFLLPDGSLAGSPAFGTALWAVGEKGVAALKRAHLLGFGLLADLTAQRIEAGTGETPQEVRPEGREPDGEAGAPNQTQPSHFTPRISPTQANGEVSGSRRGASIQRDDPAALVSPFHASEVVAT